MKASRLLIILVLATFTCCSLSYAQGASRAVNKDAKKEEAGKEKPARQVRDRNDALQIAKDYLQQQKLQADYHLVGHMTKPLAKLKEGVWHVVFLKKKADDRTVGTESIRIKIEGSTGYVIEHEDQTGFFIDRSFR